MSVWGKSSSLFYVFMDGSATEVNTHKKKNETNIPPYGLSAKAINDLLYGYKRKLFLYLTTKQIQQKAIAVQKKHT